MNDNLVKLADFGTSKILADENLKYYNNNIANTCCGTFFFMSPEILHGKGWVPKSDIWSLGVTFYFMLAKELPWGNDTGSSFKLLLKDIG